MDIAGSRVGIIGGSIAGCATAIALGRLGCDVTILERSSTGLKDRGSGIAIPVVLREELVASGYLPANFLAWGAAGRRWVVADGSHGGDCRWIQPGPATTNNWGELWRGLRVNIGAADYLDGAQVTAVADHGDRVRVDLADGAQLSFDVLFGADGYRSAVRSELHPYSAPRYAGYILWRGNFPADELTDRDAWEEVLDSREWITVGFDGGHGVMYPIPDFHATTLDQLRVNWAIYGPCPDDLTIEGPSSIPPGEVSEKCFAQLEQLLGDHIPPRLRPVFSSPRDEVSIQPIYDEAVDTYTRGRIALIGDAATLSRPHTGSGATKALQDARLLETLGASHSEWESLLAAYDEDRSRSGQALVELGRRIGRDQVERTPPWHTMTPADFEAWTAGTLSGQSLYFWGADSERTRIGEPQEVGR